MVAINIGLCEHISLVFVRNCIHNLWNIRPSQANNTKIMHPIGKSISPYHLYSYSNSGIRHSGAVTSILKLKMVNIFNNAPNAGGHLIVARENKART